MRRINFAAILPFLLLVLMVALCAAVPAHAGGPFSTKKIVTGGPVNFFPSADPNGNLWLTKSHALYKVTPSGSMIYEGVANGGVDSPVWFRNGLAMYDTGSGNNKPVVWDWTTGTFNYPCSDWSARPWIAPRVSGSGQKVVFATGKNEIAVFDGTATTRWTQWNPSEYQLASLDWLDNSTLIATVQDRYDAAQYGYHLMTIDLATHQTIDYGKGFSQVAVAGTEIMLTAWNHQSLGRYRMSGGTLQFTESIHTAGVYYWNLGGGAITEHGPLFTALDEQENLWAIGSPGAVPEPGSMLAMLTGLIGLGGFVLRRRK